MANNNNTPADDVREALAKRIADEVEYRVRTAVTLAMNGYEYEQHVTQGRDSVAAILAEARPYGTVTDTEVEAAARALVIAEENGPYDYLLDTTIDYYLDKARAALEAAQKARNA